MRTRRRLPLLRVLLLLVVVFVACVGAAMVFWRVERVVVCPGALAGGTVQVRAPRNGVVSAVAVRAGQAVEEDDLLLRLDTRDLEALAGSERARLEGLRAEREARASERSRLVDSVHPMEVEEAVATLERARVAEERARIEATAAGQLGEQGIVGRIDVRKCELDLKLAVMARERAGESIELLDAQHRAVLEALGADERKLDGEIEAVRIAMDASVARIAASEVRAPARGTVEADRLEDIVGRAVAEGDDLLRVLRDGPERFEGVLGDGSRASVASGQTARIRLDGFPWLIHGTVRGTVEQVADRRGASAGFTVEIRLDRSAGGPGPLREGMSGAARIFVDERVTLWRLFLERITGRAEP